LEFVLEELRLLCVVQISSNTFVPIVEFGLEGNIPSLLCGVGIDYYTSGGSRFKSCVCSSVGC
jgi:hypothetical protein